MDWTEGYVTDLLYTYGYYQELNPLNTQLLFLSAGMAVKKEFKTACELGFGQGMSVNIHACASHTDWYGTDFNPSQVDFAATLAQESQFKVNLYDDSFEDFINNPDLPMFDFIGLHGIWSWINDDARAGILKFIQKKLSVGGVVYCSYNVNPGFLQILPIQHLLKRHADLNGKGEGSLQSVRDSINFVQELFKTNPRYAVQNPLLQARFNDLVGKDQHYLAHEYFNAHWDLMHFDEISALFAEQKLQFAVSANYNDSIDTINLTADQQSLLSKISNRDFKETVRDFIINQQFRRDYFVKGLRFLEKKEQEERIQELKVIFRDNLEDFNYKTRGILGEVNLKEEVYKPIIEFLADYQIHSIGEIFEAVKDKVNFGSLISALLILSGKGSLCAAQEPDDELTAQCRRLNQQILKRTTTINPISYLASPVTGGGIFMGQINQIILIAYQNSKQLMTEDELTAYLRDLLGKSNANLQVSGKSVSANSPEGQQEIAKMAHTFIQSVPALKALRILD